MNDIETAKAKSTSKKRNITVTSTINQHLNQPADTTSRIKSTQKFDQQWGSRQARLQRNLMKHPRS